MIDFETHPRGTAKELELSRALANEIGAIIEQYGNVIPDNVLKAYNRLKELYNFQLEQ